MAVTELEEKQIWNTLYSFFEQNPYATAGMMGNLYAESELRPIAVQGDYLKKNRDEYCRSYVTDVDMGYVSKVDFIKFGPGGGGFGLAQWTYSTRKQGLYELAKLRNKSIGDLSIQLEYLTLELQTTFLELTKKLKTARTVSSASDLVLTKFEQPLDQSNTVRNKRTNYGLKYYNKYGRKGSVLTTVVDTVKKAVSVSTTGTVNLKKTTENTSFKVGEVVYIKDTAKNYATGQTIPSWLKGTPLFICILQKNGTEIVVSTQKPSKKIYTGILKATDLERRG